MLENFIEYNPVKDNYKDQKFIILPNIKDFCKGRRQFLIAFKNIYIFPLPKPYVFGKNLWKEKDLDREEFMPKNSLNRNILEKLGHTPLAEKENELLNVNFGHKDIDKLENALNNADTREEYNKSVNFLCNIVNILKKLVKTLSDNVEKKRINNVARSVNINLKRFLDQDIASESDSSDNHTDFDFSSVYGEGIKI